MTLISAPGIDVNVTFSDPDPDAGKTAFWYAAIYGPKKVALALAKAGADVNAKPTTGPNQDETALLTLAHNGNWWTIKDLLKLDGIDVNATTTTGPDAGKTAFWYAVNTRQFESAFDLANAGADVNAKYDNGDTALLAAVKDTENLTPGTKSYYDAWDVVKALIHLPGMNLDETDEEGLTVSDYAKSYRRNDIVTLINSVKDNATKQGTKPQI